MKISKDQQQGEEAATNGPKCAEKAAANQGRKKRIRTAFTSWQLAVMEAQFQVQQYLVGEQRVQFATRLGLNETQVKIWFQNRRIRFRRNQRTMRLEMAKDMVEKVGKEEDDKNKMAFES